MNHKYSRTVFNNEVLFSGWLVSLSVRDIFPCGWEIWVFMWFILSKSIH